MKSYALCPVSDKMINERVARLNGVFTLVLLIVYALTQNIIPVVFLAVDFLLRSSDYSKYSLVGISSKGIVRYFGFSENIINAGPKIFAARLGLLFSTLIVSASLFGAWVLHCPWPQFWDSFPFLKLHSAYALHVKFTLLHTGSSTR